MSPKRTAAAAAAVLALGAAPAALAVDHVQTLSFGATLLDQPKGAPWAVSLDINATMGAADGGLNAPLRHVFFAFPKGAKVNGDLLPVCKAKTPEQILSCPKASKVGGGTAIIDARPLVREVPAKLQLFNGPGNAKSRTLIVTADTQDAGIQVNLVLPGTLKRASGPYSYTFDVDIPEIKAVASAPPIAITKIDIGVGSRVKKKGKKLSFIDAPTSCPKGGWPFQGKFTFGDGAVPHLNSRLDCTLRTVNS